MKTLSSFAFVGLVSLSLAACGGKKDESKAADPKPETGEPAKEAAAPAKKGAVPTETAPLALDTDGNAIPATIDAPKGSTIFADEPTSLRVEFGNGEAFGVQITKGNEFNLNFEEFAGELAKNQYGNKNEILEKSDTLLRYTMTSEDSGSTTNNFMMIKELNGEKWICQHGNMGGWSKEQSDAQIAVCNTLKAK